MTVEIAVKVADCPAQIVELFTVSVGISYTVTFEVADDVGQPANTTVTEYCVLDVGFTLILGVVSPVLHA